MDALIVFASSVIENVSFARHVFSPMMQDCIVTRRTRRRASIRTLSPLLRPLRAFAGLKMHRKLKTLVERRSSGASRSLRFALHRASVGLSRVLALAFDLRAAPRTDLFGVYFPFGVGVAGLVPMWPRLSGRIERFMLLAFDLARKFSFGRRTALFIGVSGP
jgi:hypothetical protein